MTTIPVQRDPMDFTARPEVWTPAGTTGEVTTARNLKVGDQVLVYRSSGYWVFSDANPDATPRYSQWATVTERVRRCFQVRIMDGWHQELAVRKLDHLVVRRTMPVSVHDFEPGHSGMSCVRMVERPDGTGDACGEPVKSAIHDPAGYSAYATDLKAELAKFTRREPPYDTPDALDLALECAFPSQRTELETMRDKLNGHLEAAENRMEASVGSPYYREHLAAYVALKALKADLGL